MRISDGSSYVCASDRLEALWYLAAPDRLGVQPPDPDPRTLRRTLREGVGRLLSNLHRHDGRIVLFVDSFDQCDEASAALLRDLARPARPPPMAMAPRAEDVPRGPGKRGRAPGRERGGRGVLST